MTNEDRAGNEELREALLEVMLNEGILNATEGSYNLRVADLLAAAALAATPTQTGAEGPGDYWRGVRDAKAAADARVGFDISSPPWDDEDCRYECPLTEEGHRATDADHEFVGAALRSGAEVAAAPGLAVDEKMLRWVAAQPIGFGDWACRDCRPDSDMIVDDFRCMVHEARARLTAKP